MPTHGISALVPTWDRDDSERGVAGFVDTSTSPGADGAVRTLDDVCAGYQILAAGLPEGLHARDTLRRRHRASGEARRDPHATDVLLATAVAHSLAVALAAARMRGRYRWDELDLAALLFREAWDHLPTLTPGLPAPSPAPTPTSTPATTAAAPAPTATGDPPPARVSH